MGKDRICKEYNCAFSFVLFFSFCILYFVFSFCLGHSNSCFTFFWWLSNVHFFNSSIPLVLQFFPIQSCYIIHT